MSISGQGDRGSPAGIRAVLRPAFAAALAVSQFTSRRGGFLSQNAIIVGAGLILLVAGLWLWVEASRHLRRARQARIVATTGPYAAIRHPVYVSMYLICIGLGLIFFAWLWHVVLLAFAPLWWLEARSEEQQMMDEFGEAYVRYKAHTPMFIPGTRPGSSRDGA